MNLGFDLYPSLISAIPVRARSPLILLGQKEVILDGQLISYTLKRSHRARCVRLEVRERAGLTVVVPRSYKLQQLDDLLKRKASWILGKTAQYVQNTPLFAPRELKSGDSIPYLGEELQVAVCQQTEHADHIERQQNTLVICRASEQDRLNSLLERWYRTQAARLIEQKVRRLTARLGLSYARLTIRGQRTRWGSCSCKGNLSFNWRLIMAPEPVVDYVIIHEVVHLKEMNHTRRFWGLVAEQCPSWREHRKWLNDHGAELSARLVCPG